LASVLVPLMLVAPAQIGELTTGASELACTVTPAEAALWHSPEAVALAVTTFPADNAATLLVQLPPLTVVVPALAPLTNTSMIVPLASVLVPLMLVAPAQIGELTTGASELACTITVGWLAGAGYGPVEKFAPLNAVVVHS
jgi:hypothetical protein